MNSGWKGLSALWSSRSIPSSTECAVVSRQVHGELNLSRADAEPARKSGRRLGFALSGLVLGLFLFAASAIAQEITVESIPNVHLQNRLNYVSNPDGILQPQAVARINMLAKQIQDSMGIQIAVVAVKSIGDNEARMFATELFQHWGLGQKNKDNGLLIQLVTDPPNRSIVFENGYGLEGVLPDAISYRLQQRYMVPDFEQGNFSAGMVKGVEAVSQYLQASDYERTAMISGTEEEYPVNPLWGLAFLVVLLFLFRKNPAALLAFLAVFGGRGGGGGFGGGGFGGGSWGGGSSGGGGSMSRF